VAELREPQSAAHAQVRALRRQSNGRLQGNQSLCQPPLFGLGKSRQGAQARVLGVQLRRPRIDPLRGRVETVCIEQRSQVAEATRVPGRALRRRAQLRQRLLKLRRQQLRVDSGEQLRHRALLGALPPGPIRRTAPRQERQQRSLGP
jgi:hypothetical protein